MTYRHSLTTMRTLKSVELHSTAHSSDKLYRIQIVEVSGGFIVNFQYGRRGTQLNSGGTKTRQPVSESEARRIYEQLKASKVHGPSSYRVLKEEEAPPSSPSPPPSAVAPPDFSPLLSQLRQQSGPTNESLFW